MIAGTIGAETVRSYTVIGDAVNLGARLESLNKEYGTQIIISDFTVGAADETRYNLRPLGQVTVKGKSVAVEIFEVVADIESQGRTPAAAAPGGQRLMRNARRGVQSTAASGRGSSQRDEEGFALAAALVLSRAGWRAVRSTSSARAPRSRRRPTISSSPTPRRASSGQQVSEEIRSEVRRRPGPGGAPLRDAGRRRARHATARGPDLPWTFIVLDTDAVNAFAAPGGFVHITKGALALMANEAELAGVLGHELIHVTEKHTIAALKKAGGISLAHGASGKGDSQITAGGRAAR